MKSCTANKTAFSAGAALSFLIIVALLSDPHPSDPHLRAVAGLLALVSCGVVAWRFRGEMVARRQAQAGLRQAQEELENRVAQRTAEVNTANVALQAEVLERQRAEAALRTTRDELEIQIAERTRALADANHVLQREIVERRQITEALQNSRALYHSLVEHLPVHIWRTDSSGRFTFVNHHLCAWLGVAPDDVLGRSVFAFYTTATAEKYAREDRMVLETGEACESIQEFETRTGRQGFVQLLKAPFHDTEGRVLGVQGISWEVTERKRAEEEMRRIQTQLERTNADLRRKNQEVQNFYHTLSHELKTPLTSAREFISIVMDGLAGQLNHTQTEYLGIARQSCNQLCVYINDLLDATRLETGKLSIDLRPASLGALVRRVVRTLRPVAQRKKIELSCEVELDLPDINLDENRMTQVITNLLNNALKFTGTGGHIVTRVSQSADQPDCQVATVSDTGRGIPSDQLERIFDRLHQIDTGDATAEQGVGLGLFICRELVCLHGGDIRVESEPGLGSAFTVTLPARVPPVRAHLLVVTDDA